MNSATPSLEDRFVGCLLGLAIGDALGAPFEGQSADALARRYRTARDLIENPPSGELWYTDDTQMAIGVAETLITCGRIDEDEICKRFAANYLPQRGYGRGARVVLDAMVEGRDHKKLAANTFPGGSFGNGAAMRVAPVGLMFRQNHTEIWEQAKLSALPTHVHPLGIEGAQILALAVGQASTMNDLVREEFFANLSDRCAWLEFSGPLGRAARLTDIRDLGRFGNGIEATASVVTAVASFGLTPDSYEETIGNAILLGGDTDTIAAMAGAISGAYLGRSAIPNHLLENLEDRHQGRTHIEELAAELYAAHKGTVGDNCSTIREPTMTEQNKIETFLAGRRFAVVGASSNRAKYGNKVLRAYLQNGLEVVPVSPNSDEVEGLKSSSDLKSLPDPVDSISIVTPPPVTEQVVEQAIELGIKNIWMQPGAESERAVEHAERAGVNVIAGGPCVLVALGYRES